jgi:hypothetical protein
MAKTVSMVGIDPGELPWLRVLLFLLRHPDPLTVEMARQALLYLQKNAHERPQPCAAPIDYAG